MATLPMFARSTEYQEQPTAPPSYSSSMTFRMCERLGGNYFRLKPWIDFPNKKVCCLPSNAGVAFPPMVVRSREKNRVAPESEMSGLVANGHGEKSYVGVCTIASIQSICERCKANSVPHPTIVDQAAY